MLERIEALGIQYQVADRVYFEAMDYKTAERLNREWLRQCPDDEHAKTHDRGLAPGTGRV